MKTLEDLLRTEVDGISPVTKEPIKWIPHFEIAVQHETKEGLHIIVHPLGFSGETLDFMVKGNTLELL